MIHDASTDDWERRRRAQAAAFDAIGARYDEAFPHRRYSHGSVRTMRYFEPAGIESSISLSTAAAERSTTPAGRPARAIG